MSLATGEIIDGKYRIVRVLGAGGMGTVYEGENVRIRRRVAIKVLHESFSTEVEAVARFEREAQAAARIGSEHICEVLDLGILPDGTRYMVMEYLEGETLGERIQKSGRLGPQQIVPIMTQVLDALGAAHASGIIHRDLKPENVFIVPNKSGITDFVKILDFGVSKFSQLGGGEMHMTRAGAVVGTPYYMSPEQARGAGQVDQRSDIYALGVLLYQATTGQVPFDASTFNELLFKIVLEQAPPPQHFVPDLDPDFAGIIQRAMAREPPQRFQACREFKEALVAWLASRAGAAAAARPATSPAHALTPAVAASGLAWADAPRPGLGTPPASPPLTASSWGNASGLTGQTPRPASRKPLVAALMGTLGLLGAGLAGWLVLGREAPEPAPAVSESAAAPMPLAPSTGSTTSVVIAPAPPSASGPPAETTPSTSDAPVASALPSAGVPPALSVTGPRPAPSAKPGPSSSGSGRARPPSSSKPARPSVPGDFGY